METSAAYIAGILARTPIPRYRVRGGKLVLLFSMDADTTMDTTSMYTIKDTVLAAGFKIASLDLPAHGADATVGVQPLAEWKNRIAAGDTTLFSNFAKRVSRLIDAERADDVGIVGLSRGCYCACVAAAGDARIKRLYLNSPVTDLQKLSEFNGYTVNQATFGLSQYAAALATKAVMVRTFSTDARVDATAALSFASSVGASTDVVSGSGHGVEDTGQAAAWLLSKISP